MEATENDQNYHNSYLNIFLYQFFFIKLTHYLEMEYSAFYRNICNGLDVKLNRTSSVPKSVLRYKLDKVSA